jgi:hypothetical protein
MMATYFGAGKSLPMWRGGGIDQALLLQLARKAVGGEPSGRSADWIHVYPEAGVYQYKNKLGGRGNGKENELGRLKWGIGKLIAHNPSYRIAEDSLEESATTELRHVEDKRRYKSPVVIPFYFVGTEEITPFKDPSVRVLRSIVPELGGHSVAVKFGPPVYFDDLIDEFLEGQGLDRRGLRVYHCCGDPSAHSEQLTGGEDSSTLMVGMQSWKSTERERELYHRITLRAEAALQKLCDECVDIDPAKL